MQYPVPQFTDVEDKIIGSLTIKQFGILFGTGIIIFVGYSTTKSLAVTIFLLLIVGLPGLGIAIGKFYGRPIYNTFGFMIQFLLSPKVLIFHKEASSSGSGAKFKNMEARNTEAALQTKPAENNTRQNLRDVEKLLQATEDQEKALIDQK